MDKEAAACKKKLEKSLQTPLVGGWASVLLSVG